MKYSLNSYIGLLLVAIAGSGAAFIILHVALDNTFAQFKQQNDSMSLELLQSIQQAQTN